MRLVCPECTAQYEVAAGVIPEAGRDVQCSACGHGWFQRPTPVPLPETSATDVTPPAAAQAPAAASVPPPPPPPRKPLDEKVMAILREEALREAAARRAELSRDGAQGAPVHPPAASPRPAAEVTLVQPTPAPVPSPKVTLVQPAPAPVPPPEVTLVQPAPALAPLPEVVRPAARRGLLPDIEEINSTLAAGTRPDFGPRPPADPRPGFRTGFGLMMGVVGIAAGAYVLAPRISAAVPETAEAMTAYVGGVDQLRRQLDMTFNTVQARVEAVLLNAD